MKVMKKIVTLKFEVNFEITEKDWEAKYKIMCENIQEAIDAEVSSYGDVMYCDLMDVYEESYMNEVEDELSIDAEIEKEHGI